VKASLIACHVCSEDVTTQYVKIQMFDRGVVSGDMFFHCICFEEVAGDEYVTELSGPPSLKEPKSILKCGDCGVIGSRDRVSLFHCDTWWWRKW